MKIFCQRCLVHVSMYSFKFFHKKMLNNKKVVAEFQERLFFEVTCGGHHVSRTVHLKSKIQKNFVTILYCLVPERRVCKNFDLKKIGDVCYKICTFSRYNIFDFVALKKNFSTKLKILRSGTSYYHNK